MFKIIIFMESWQKNCWHLRWYSEQKEMEAYCLNLAVGCGSNRIKEFGAAMQRGEVLKADRPDERDTLDNTMMQRIGGARSATSRREFSAGGA